MAVTGPPEGGGCVIAGSLRPFTTRASHNASAEGADEMVKAPALRSHGTTVRAR
jgi:hypothetical protein